MSLWLTYPEVRINEKSQLQSTAVDKAPQPTRPAQGLSLHVQPAEMMRRIYSPHFSLHLSHHFATCTDALPVPVGGRIFPFTTPAVIKFRATKGASQAVKHHQKKRWSGRQEASNSRSISKTQRNLGFLSPFPSSLVYYPVQRQKKQSHCL